MCDTELIAVLGRFGPQPPRLGQVKAAKAAAGAGKTLTWCGCSQRARLKYSHSTVARDEARALAARHCPSDIGSTRTGSTFPTWSRCYAVAAADVLSPAPGLLGSSAFEVVVQIGDATESAPASTMWKGARSAQLHIGLTCLPPDEGLAMSEEPYASGKDCWMLSACSSMCFRDGEPVDCAVALEEEESEEKSPSAQPLPGHPRLRRAGVRSLRLRVVLTAEGVMQLFVEGSLLAQSPEDFVPRMLANRAGALFPVVVLGPNVAEATLWQVK